MADAQGAEAHIRAQQGGAVILENADIVLGVTGGIAAYKAVDLCSKLIQAGAFVDVVMTEAAIRFVTPLSFQAISKRPVSVDMFQPYRSTEMAHISLAKRADAILVAPATANTIAKIAHGYADNLLTSTILASTAPLIIAPAMDADMWSSSITQANVETVKRNGAIVVGPGYGRLASGRIGAGRLTDTQKILAALRQTLGRNGPLASLRVTVTAGGTQEPLDPVRHLGNRSSGRMGYALAQAARDYGASVTLVSAQCSLPAVSGVEMISVRTASDMHRAVMDLLDRTDILVMAAAVADFRPSAIAPQKIKKGLGALSLNLERTQDILSAVRDVDLATRPRIVVGFAAETQELVANAQMKLEEKALDLIVANDVSASDSGFAVDTNRVILLSPSSPPESLPLMSKCEVAEKILDRVVAIWERYDG